MIKNAKTLPKVYYGLHFYPGVAEYREPEKDAYRIFIGEDAIKNMGPTFAGRPVYVQHVDEVDLENIQNEADGYVMESFFNPVDGKHWVKFLIVSDRGHEAKAKGWKLSNAYTPKETSGGGVCNGVEYAYEVMRGEYDHLAIVPNPRYEESVILTPEEFKAYNAQKEIELKALANSKEKKETVSMLNLFKKTKVDNSADFESMSVTLPKSKKEMTLSDLVTEMDTIKNMHGYANGEHMVKVGEEEMSVNALVEKHMAACNEMGEMKKKNEEKKEPELANEEKKEPELANDDSPEAMENKKKNDEQMASEKKEKDAEVKKNAHFDALKNAPSTVIREEVRMELGDEKVARGKSRYGSN